MYLRKCVPSRIFDEDMTNEQLEQRFAAITEQLDRIEKMVRSLPVDQQPRPGCWLESEVDVLEKELLRKELRDAMDRFAART